MARELLSGLLRTVSSGRKLQMPTRCVYYLKKDTQKMLKRQFTKNKIWRKPCNGKQIICMQTFALQFRECSKREKEICLKIHASAKIFLHWESKGGMWYFCISLKYQTRPSPFSIFLLFSFCLPVLQCILQLKQQQLQWATKKHLFRTKYKDLWIRETCSRWPSKGFFIVTLDGHSHNLTGEI